jgi:hypothetical protein
MLRLQLNYALASEDITGSRYGCTLGSVPFVNETRATAHTTKQW